MADERMGDREAPRFEMGRLYTVVEVIVIARRATFDPGKFTMRLADHNGPEPLSRWQARAVVVALGPDGPSFEPLWSNGRQAARNLLVAEVDAVASPVPGEECRDVA